MNILQVHKYLKIEGGADVVMFETARFLKKRGHHVAFFGMNHPANEVTGQEPYWVDYIDYHAPMSAWRKARLALKSVYSAEAATKMRRLLRDLPQDVAHLHNYHHQLTPSVLGPLKAAGVPMVWTLHDFQLICPNYLLFDPHRLEICEECKGGHYFNATCKRCLKGSLLQSFLASLEAHAHRLLNTYGRAIDCFIPPSRFLAEKIVEHGIPRDRVTQIPNPQSLDGCAPQEKDGYILYFGRLDREKGVLTLLKAMERRRDLELRMAGRGRDEALCRRYAEEHRLDNVKFLGFMRDGLKDLIARARFTIIPSEWYENYPLAVLESHACGTATLGAEIGGIPELIAAGVDGMTFRSGDVGHLMERIDALCAKSNAELREMGMAGREKVARENNEDLYIERLEGVYRRVMRK